MGNYELLDSGNFEKLEKWGEFALRRPDPQAIWEKSLKAEVWAKADATFTNELKWNTTSQKLRGTKEAWSIEIGGLTMQVSLFGFKHTGVFPEHVANWKWIKEKTKKGGKILNLFGYTGGATLAAAQAGAEVVHVDSSKGSVDGARENAKLSGLEDAPIRWIVDDALMFVTREITRKNSYDGIILDPPSFGRGAKGEVWKIEEGLVPLLEKCKNILNPGGFVLLNGYAEGFAPDSYAQLLSSIFEIPLEKIESGKLFIQESSSRGFILPAGIYARIASV